METIISENEANVKSLAKLLILLRKILDRNGQL